MTSSEDLYVILQVRRTASVDEIKRAFRKLARRYHPDINPGDRHAEDRFKRITEAYDILSDPLSVNSMTSMASTPMAFWNSVVRDPIGASNLRVSISLVHTRAISAKSSKISLPGRIRKRRSAARIWSIRSRSALTNPSGASGRTSPSRECIDARHATARAARPVHERQHARCAAVPVRRLE